MYYTTMDYNILPINGPFSPSLALSFSLSLVLSFSLSLSLFPQSRTFITYKLLNSQADTLN